MATREKESLLDLPVGDDAPNEVNAIVEIAAGSRNKYEYDKKLGIFRVDRVLHSAVYYPGEYGFIPRTLAEDGDPLDVLVVIAEPTFPGCLISVRPIGVLGMVDGGEPDDKVLAVPVDDPFAKHLTEASQLAPQQLAAIGHFFETYKLLEGKKVEISGWSDAATAKRLIEACADRFASARAKEAAV